MMASGHHNVLMIAYEIQSSYSISPQVLGFVADLVVEEDPELSWQDYFRMAKTPNDSRCQAELLSLCMPVIYYAIHLCVS